jgi:crotonobetainyl-CoA:carnitine CoA-transferase CaiB-like acyl-CoA transferase
MTLDTHPKYPGGVHAFGGPDSSTPGPLDGVRIFSFGQALAGGECPALLADLGAEVVKVESITRRLKPGIKLWQDHPPVYEPSGVETTSGVGAIGRNQLGMSLDMATDIGRTLAHRLAAKADVMIENFSVGVMEKWGFTKEAIERDYPRLVFLSMPAFGMSGPNRNYVGFGGNMSAYAGTTSIWGISDGRHNDYIAAIHGAYAVLLGLAQRDRTGRGTFIEMPQVIAGAGLLGTYLLDSALNDRNIAPRHELRAGGVYTDVLPSSEPDSWVVIDVRDQEQWRALAEVVAAPQLLDDALYGDPVARASRDDEIRTLLSSWTEERTSHQAMSLLQHAGVCAGAVQNGEDLYRDPQLWARDMVVEVDHPDLGTYQYNQSALSRMSKTPGLYRSRAARVGEHTQGVVQEWLEINDEEFGELQAAGAFA